MFRLAVRTFLICALSSLTVLSATATTIIKLDLGGVGPDIGMNAQGQLSTVDDGNAGTTGNQDTKIEFTDFLDSIPDIVTPPGSFTLSGLAVAGPSTQIGSLVIQNFTGGQFALYDPTNILLLSGPLTNSALTGVIGAPGTGALFTTTLANATGGSLASLIQSGTLSLSLSMTNVNGGAGFSTSDGILQPFLADGSINIAADRNQAPEPATFALLTMGAIGLLASRRRLAAPVQG
jgi:PEP-CTERM motif